MSEKIEAGVSVEQPMVATEEPVDDSDVNHDPVRDTGNGPTVSYEEALLERYFGEPEDGVYGRRD